MTDTNKERAEFESFWRDTRGERKARRELVPHDKQPQTYISDSANRHYVTWRAARASQGAAAPKADLVPDAGKMVPAPLQQGEYLPLPVPDTHCYDEGTGKDVWSHSAEQMHAYVDADRAMRAAHQGDGVPTWQAAQDPVAEDAEIRKALDDAATALETISRIAGRDQYLLGMMDVRLYAASRAKVAREAQAAQPEGGAK